MNGGCAKPALDPTVAVAAGSAAAAELAVALSLPLLADQEVQPHLLLLAYRDGRLQLEPADRSSGAVWVDFAGGASRHRLQGGADLVVRAIRGRSKGSLWVVDATAGLGRDAFVLAARGFQVTMIERSPLVAALLADGLQRAAQSAEPLVAEAAARLTLCCADAVEWLRGATASAPDVIYLDPMFPDERKSALPKKEMRLFQRLLAHGDDGPALLHAALQRASRRVVVKRPPKGPPLGGVLPAYVLAGKAVRFDVHALPHSAEQEA